MSLSEVEAEMAAAVAALKSGDYDTALVRAMCAQGLIAVSPDFEHSTGQSERKVSWSLDRIDKFIERIERRLKSGLGVQTNKITYARVTNTG